MLVVDTLLFEGLLVVVLVLLLEDVHEETIVLLENSVLGGQHEGHVTIKSIREARLGEGSN